MQENILNIETSTSVCSVSVCKGESIVAYRESLTGKSHASMLTVFIGEAMEEAGLKFKDLSAVAVSRGPGSYTGLRIGVSTAKGICYAADLQLISVDTLKIMAHKVISMAAPGEPALHSTQAAGPGEGDKEKLLLCPMIDARRMEVYMALFDYRGNQVSKISAEIIDDKSFSSYTEANKIMFFGDGAEKCRKVLEGNNTSFIPGIYPSSREMVPLALKYLHEERFEDTAYFEPFYLKDFIATTPRQK